MASKQVAHSTDPRLEVSQFRGPSFFGPRARVQSVFFLSSRLAALFFVFLVPFCSILEPSGVPKSTVFLERVVDFRLCAVLVSGGTFFSQKVPKQGQKGPQNGRLSIAKKRGLSFFGPRARLQASLCPFSFLSALLLRPRRRSSAFRVPTGASKSMIFIGRVVDFKLFPVSLLEPRLLAEKRRNGAKRAPEGFFIFHVFRAFGPSGAPFGRHLAPVGAGNAEFGQNGDKLEIDYPLNENGTFSDPWAPQMRPNCVLNSFFLRLKPQKKTSSRHPRASKRALGAFPGAPRASKRALGVLSGASGPHFPPLLVVCGGPSLHRSLLASLFSLLSSRFSLLSSLFSLRSSLFSLPSLHSRCPTHSCCCSG